jgi:hypothetical protein
MIQVAAVVMSADFDRLLTAVMQDGRCPGTSVPAGSRAFSSRSLYTSLARG